MFLIIQNGNYVVYAHINKTNRKIYIGITSQKPENRWRNGDGYKGCVHFYNAILKYGWDGFDHEIFASNLTQEEAANMERILIKKLNTQNIEYGYNLAEGGMAGHAGTHMSDTTKQKIAESMKGRHLSEEKKAYFSNFWKGKRPPAGRGRSPKAILCVETGEIFDCLVDAAKAKGIKSSRQLSAVAKGEEKTAGGYHWQYYTSSIS